MGHYDEEREADVAYWDSSVPRTASVISTPSGKSVLHSRQVGGTHYKSLIDPDTYITANKLDFREGNVVKYVTRWRKKNGLEDLLKARDYLDRLIREAS